MVVLDCGGVTFADAAGAREVVQVRERAKEEVPLWFHEHPLMDLTL